MNIEMIAISCVFLSIATAVWLIGRILFPAPEAEKNSRPSDAFGALTVPFANAFPLGKKKRKKLQQEMTSAGHYNSNALNNFLARRNLAVMVCIIGIVWFLAFDEFPGNEWKVAMYGGSLAILFYSIPRLILSAKSKTRSRKIEYALPDALDMVSMSIEGGVPLGRSLNLVADEFKQTHKALSQELKIISRQSETGSLEKAMGLFADRLNLPEVVAWSAMLKQSQRLGVRMVDSMRDYADRIRENRKQKAEASGQIATVKLLLPVVLCLAPPIFILLIGPAILDFRNFINRERQAGTELIQRANETPSISAPSELR